MKGASFRAGEVLESLTWYDLPDDEEAAYDAPFPSRIYMGGPRTFPSLVEQLSGLNEQAWAALSAFSVIGEGGLGASCTSDDDCAGQTANVCLSNPGEEGFCTIEGCDAGTCGAPFVCCRDCNPAAAGSLPFDGAACVPDQVSSQLSGGAGCTCD